VVTWRDILILIQHLGRNRYDPLYDLNGDGRVTGRDLQIALAQLGQSCRRPG
jgi:hypothetical protein